MVDNKNGVHTKMYPDCKKAITFIVLLVSYILLYRTRMWASFEDEADNFTGGWLISNGAVLYKDIFSHHMPFPYYYAASLIKLGLSDISSLRLGMSLTILFFWLLIIIIFKNKIDYKSLCITIFLYALAHSLFLGQMLLADLFFGYSILIIFLYIFSSDTMNYSLKEQVVIAIMVYIAIMSALIAIVPLLIVGGYYAYKKYPLTLKEVSFVLIIITPLILTLFYFYMTEAITDFFQQAYLFNKTYLSFDTAYYSPFWLILLMSMPWIENVPWFFEMFLITSTLIFALLTCKKNDYVFAGFYLLFFFSLRLRGAWVHGVASYLLGFFTIGFLVSKVINNKAQFNIKSGIYVMLGVIFLITTLNVYFANSANMSIKPYSSTYDKVIQTLTHPNDTIWVAPDLPSLYFTNKRVPATKYLFYFPWNAKANGTDEDIIKELSIKKPLLIIFERDTVIWGKYTLKDYGNVIEEYIGKNYRQYSKEPIYQNIYIRKDPSKN